MDQTPILTNASPPAPLSMKAMIYDPNSEESYTDFVQRKRKRNNDYLSSLGFGENNLSSMQADLNRTKAARRSSSKPRVKPAKGVREPSRRSGRVRGEVVDDGFFVKKDTGGKIEINGVLNDDGTAGIAPTKVMFYDDRINDGEDVEAWEAYEEEDQEGVKKSFLEIFSSCGISSPEPAAKKKKKAKAKAKTTLKFSADNPASISDYLSNLTSSPVVLERNIKVTPEKIYSVCCAPTTQKLVCFVGDVWGHIGVYDSSAPEHEQLYSKPHSRVVTHLDYSPTSDKLLSVSYDCTVRLMDAETGVHTQLLATYGTNEAADKFKGEPGYGVDEGEGYFTQYGCWDKENGVANGKGIWLTSSTGNLVFYDTRSGKVEINGNVSQKKVNTMSQHPFSPHVVAVGGLDREVKLFDIRKFGTWNQKELSKTGNWKTSKTPKPFATHAFAGSINSSFFSPSGSYLLTTSTADVLTLTKDAHLQKGDMNDGSQVIKHDNRTGRYLATFMARWHGRHDIFTVGSMKKPRQLEVFSLDGKGFKCTGKIKGDAVSAVCSRNCFHDTMPVLVGGSSSGRIVVAGMD